MFQERKKTTCEEALKNKEVLFQIFTETMENKTVAPKASCRGWVSINGLNGKTIVGSEGRPHFRPMRPLVQLICNANAVFTAIKISKSLDV